MPKSRFRCKKPPEPETECGGQEATRDLGPTFVTET